MMFYPKKSPQIQMNVAAIKGNIVNLDTEKLVKLGTLEILETGKLETLGTAKIFTIAEVLRLIKIKVVS